MVELLAWNLWNVFLSGWCKLDWSMCEGSPRWMMRMGLGLWYVLLVVVLFPVMGLINQWMYHLPNLTLTSEVKISHSESFLILWVWLGMTHGATGLRNHTGRVMVDSPTFSDTRRRQLDLFGVISYKINLNLQFLSALFWIMSHWKYHVGLSILRWSTRHMIMMHVLFRNGSQDIYSILKFDYHLQVIIDKTI